MTLKELREARDAARAEAKKILDRCDAEDHRDMTPEEDTAFENAMAEVERLSKRIRNEERIGTDADWETPTGRRTTPDGDTQTREPENIEGGPIECRVWNSNLHEHETVTLREDDPGYMIAQDEYDREFRRFLTHPEERTFSLQQGDQGGNWASQQIANMFFQGVDDVNWFRGLANNIDVIGSGSLGIFGIDTDPSDAEWTSEISSSDISADTAMKSGKRELNPHVLMKRFDASRTIFRRVPRVEQYVISRLAYKVGITEEKAFISGSGANQPLGIFTADDAGISTSRDVALGSTTNFTADGLLDVQYALKQQYRRRAGWFLHRDSVLRIRKLKSATSPNEYLWVNGLGGEPSLLLGSPVYESEYAPNTYSSGNYGVVYGDLSQYTIATSVRIEMLRDQFTGAGQNKVRLYVYHEVDGMPIQEEA
ncbi:MAG TPA: phage major capsid protein, partial [Planctomycetaceae bacterium]|nr:phage major capsid protein [Planctomycetaceae bacterium]